MQQGKPEEEKKKKMMYPLVSDTEQAQMPSETVILQDLDEWRGVGPWPG